MLDAIACPAARMIRRNPLEAAPTFLESRLSSLHEAENLGRDLLRCHWKVRAIHLIERCAPQGVPHRGWQERDPTMWLIERGKKREPLDMVPMGMRQQHKDIGISRGYGLSQRTHTSTCVQHQAGIGP